MATTPQEVRSAAARPVVPASLIPHRHGEHLSERVDTTQFETPFDYLFEDLAADFPDKHLPGDPATVVQKLRDLGSAMLDAAPPDESSRIPAVYTYWGQFVDHDLTANTDRNNDVDDIRAPNVRPLPPNLVRRDLKNLRQPALNLDSVYGPGAALNGDGGMKLGRAATKQLDGTDVPGQRIPKADDLDRDLPRLDRVAQIGDPRNDENLIVAQLHLAFLRFHNAAADWTRRHHPDWKRPRVFERAQKLTQLTYQFITVNDYLRTVTLPGTVDDVLYSESDFELSRYRQVYMPLEFSIAAFRFGHSMIRGGYDFNRNFGLPAGSQPPLVPFASMDLLFTFTGGGRPLPFNGQTDVLPFNWIIEWDRITSHSSPDTRRFARKIDPLLAGPLHQLIKEGADGDIPPGSPDPEKIRRLLKDLAMRNLVRGYLLALPTGQAVANALGVPSLTPDELKSGDPGLAAALEAGGFDEATPLWFYVLKEAEVEANGQSLGSIGSRIVAETIIGQLREDPNSYLNLDWDPGKGVKFSDGRLVTTIPDFLRFAGVA